MLQYLGAFYGNYQRAFIYRRDSMKPLRYTLIIAMFIMLTPVKTPSKPMACSPPQVLDLSGPISDCVSDLGVSTTSFAWAVYWADGTTTEFSENALGTCATAWACVPIYQDPQVVEVYCKPSILHAYGTTIPAENLAYFVYQIASNFFDVNFYDCGPCYHGLGGEQGKAVTCGVAPHEEIRFPGACD
jgi:hypothetical protein